MAVSRGLRRLLRIRGLEEEQLRLALESAVAELHGLEQARCAAMERERSGRRLLGSGGVAADPMEQLTDRIAAGEETQAGARHRAALAPRIEAMEDEVLDRRQAFLAKRVERRQAETLVAESETEAELEAGRRGQQSMDEWYSSRLYRERPDGGPPAAIERDPQSAQPGAKASAIAEIPGEET